MVDPCISLRRMSEPFRCYTNFPLKQLPFSELSKRVGRKPTGHKQRAHGHGVIKQGLSVLTSTLVYTGMMGEIT